MNDSAHWEVQYARFFNFPLSLSSTPTSSFLRPIFASKKQRLKGTWLSSSSSNVSVDILFYSQTPSQPTLVVSLNERIYVSGCISTVWSCVWMKISPIQLFSANVSCGLYANCLIVDLNYVFSEFFEMGCMLTVWLWVWKRDFLALLGF